MKVFNFRRYQIEAHSHAGERSLKENDSKRLWVIHAMYKHKNREKRIA